MGLVVRENVGHISHDIILEDGTGRLRLRCLRTPTSTLLGTYVRVEGHLVEDLPFQLFCTRLRAVESPDEISHHYIEAAFCYLQKLERPV